MGSSSVSMSGDDLEIVERDPTGRYVRYDEILGEGASKTVYKAFDEDNGLEVAWSKVDIFDNILNSRKQLERLYSEAKLLKSLKHENVIRCYHSWVDNENKTFNMITELLTSGNLRDYRSKHGLLDNKVIKKWARQILTGLDYLHSHNPPIVHRDLKSENIFVNGNSGKVKIGDLGLATVLQHATAHSFIGTPEFIAPELYDEDYNQLVDIYSFGMCMLQMVTRELPYRECKNPAQVFKKVTSGIKPAALDKVVDPQIRQFIDKCLAPVTERWSATDLLNDPFLKSGDSSPLSCSPSLTESVCSSISNSPHPIQVEKVTVTKTNIFKLQGKMQDKNSISMVHWITDLDGVGEKAEFVFFLQNDTIPSVIEEMAKELMLSAEDAPLIAQLMERLITELVPDFRCCQAEAKSCSQISCLTEDDLNLHSVSTTESPEEAEDQDAKELLPEIFGVHVPLSQSGFADLSNNESESSNHDNVCPNQVQNLEDNGIQTQTKYFDLNLDNVRKEKRKCPKNVARKAVSSCLRKLLFQCWKQF